jgi:hypothetical protein
MYALASLSMTFVGFERCGRFCPENHGNALDIHHMDYPGKKRETPEDGRCDDGACPRVPCSSGQQLLEG